MNGARGGIRGRDAMSTGGHRGGRPLPVGSVLATMLNNLGLAAAIEDRRIFAEWEEVVGVSLAREAKPLKVERGVLFLGTSHGAQANHVLYLKPHILEKIRSRYPDSRIRDIRVVHRPGEGWKNG